MSVGEQTGVVYTIVPVTGATNYTWTVPTGAFITTGQGTTSVTVTFGSSSGNVCVTAGNTCGSSTATCLAVSCYTPGTVIFSYIGAQQAWTVPCGVNSVTITCYGAQGGNGNWSSTNGTGGLGGSATGNLTVTPGQILYIYVGQQGQGATSTILTAFNGGGAAYCAGIGIRGTGGGSSDVRVGGTALTNRVIVAGGGGGAYSQNGGAGGGTSGVAGTVDYPGNGGTQLAGGTSYPGFGMMDGSLGQGGGVTSTNYTFCGGGGGYYGGGGGLSGGGGSSYIGGVTGGSTSTGVWSGNGKVVLTW